MPDNLRALVNQRDKANARPHRLTGQPVLPGRGDASKRRVCLVCRRVEDALMRAVHLDRWLVENPLPSLENCRHCGGHERWHESREGWGCTAMHVVVERMPEMEVCPHDAGELIEVVG